MLHFNLKEKLRDRADQAEPHGLPWILIILLLVLLSAAVFYFGPSANYQATSANSSSHATVRSPRTYAVFYSGGVFSPTNLHIHKGDTVRFQNNSLTAVRIVPDTKKDQENGAGFTNIGAITSQNSFSYNFSTAGIFNYHNEKNPNEAGAIIIR